MCADGADGTTGCAEHRRLHDHHPCDVGARPTERLQNGVVTNTVAHRQGDGVGNQREYGSQTRPANDAGKSNQNNDIACRARNKGGFWSSGGWVLVVRKGFVNGCSNRFHLGRIFHFNVELGDDAAGAAALSSLLQEAQMRVCNVAILRVVAIKYTRNPTTDAGGIKAITGAQATSVSECCADQYGIAPRLPITDGAGTELCLCNVLLQISLIRDASKGHYIKRSAAVVDHNFDGDS